MRVRATLEITTQNMAIMGWATMIAAGGVVIYGLINAWATITSGVAILSLSSSDYSQTSSATWPVAPGASLTWPYQVIVPVAQLPSPARWLIQSGDSLTPLLWGASLAALGLVLIRVGSARSVFDQPVRRALTILSGCLVTLAVVPTGMVLFGTNWALGSLEWAAHTVTIPTAMCGHRCSPSTSASPSTRHCDMGPGSRRSWTR
jgi:TRAP-type C4-dicarboxylate transport system permease small subunit